VWKVDVSAGEGESEQVTVPAQGGSTPRSARGLRVDGDDDRDRSAAGRHGRVRRILTVTTAATGGAALLVSGVFGIVARSKWDKSRSHCAENLCDEVGMDLVRSAHRSADVATGLLIGGAALAATSAVLWLWPSRSGADVSSTARVSPTLYRRGGGISASVAF
jgi:hypothetical protein